MTGLYLILFNILFWLVPLKLCLEPCQTAPMKSICEYTADALYTSTDPELWKTLPIQKIRTNNPSPKASEATLWVEVEKLVTSSSQWDPYFNMLFISNWRLHRYKLRKSLVRTKMRICWFLSYFFRFPQCKFINFFDVFQT